MKPAWKILIAIATAAVVAIVVFLSLRKGKAGGEGTDFSQVPMQTVDDMFAVKTKNAQASVNSLSGGNVQKVVVAREYNTNSKFMIAEQPTHGIDIGSAEFVHHKLIEMRNAGAGILLVSADLNEVMSLSDRIIVMFNGQIAGYFPDANKVSESELGMYMLGAKHQTAEEIGGALND